MIRAVVGTVLLCQADWWHLHWLPTLLLVWLLVAMTGPHREKRPRAERVQERQVDDQTGEIVPRQSRRQSRRQNLNNVQTRTGDPQEG